MCSESVATYLFVHLPFTTLGNNIDTFLKHMKGGLDDPKVADIIWTPTLNEFYFFFPGSFFIVLAFTFHFTTLCRIFFFHDNYQTTEFDDILIHCRV